MANHNFNVLLHGAASDAADNLYHADCNTEPHELAAALTNALRRIATLEKQIERMSINTAVFQPKGAK